MAAIETEKKRILVVDDDEDVRRAARATLERAGFTVEDAESARGGLDQCSQHKPDLVLLDVCMPEESGYSMCRDLRWSYGSDIPILFMSVRGDLDSRLTGFRAGGQDYIAKPFRPDELIERVRMNLRLKEAPPTQEMEEAEEEETPKQKTRTRWDLPDMIRQDLRLPQAAIHEAVDIMRESNPKTAAETKLLLRCCEDSARIMVLMFKDLIARSQAQAGEMVVERRPVPVSELFTSLNNLFYPIALKRGLSLDTSTGIGVTVHTDERLALRILANLVDHAFTTSQRGESVKLRCEKKDAMIRFTISDRVSENESTGKKSEIPPGTPKDLYRELASEEYEPCLAFCRTATEALGGKVWAEDRGNGGGRFLLELPAEPSEDGDNKWWKRGFHWDWNPFPSPPSI